MQVVEFAISEPPNVSLHPLASRVRGRFKRSWQELHSFRKLQSFVRTFWGGHLQDRLKLYRGNSHFSQRPYFWRIMTPDGSLSCSRVQDQNNLQRITEQLPPERPRHTWRAWA